MAALATHNGPLRCCKVQIQATVPEPVNKNMYKGISFCFSIITGTCECMMQQRPDAIAWLSQFTPALEDLGCQLGSQLCASAVLMLHLCACRPGAGYHRLLVSSRGIHIASGYLRCGCAAP
jgi:hypothetical protein